MGVSSRNGTGALLVHCIFSSGWRGPVADDDVWTNSQSWALHRYSGPWPGKVRKVLKEKLLPSKQLKMKLV